MGAECHRCGSDIYDECSYCKVKDERDALRAALEDIIERQWDFPTDLTAEGPGWSKAFADAARLLLATDKEDRT